MAYRRRGTKRTVCRYRRGPEFSACRVQGKRAIVGDTGGHGCDVGRVAGRLVSLHCKHGLRQSGSDSQRWGWCDGSCKARVAGTICLVFV